jgi:PKD repeat protein
MLGPTGSCQTSWSFGDGSQAATGTSVSHAFATPGSYHVTVTTADVLGNTTSASSTVVVTTPSGHTCKCRVSRPLVLSKVRITNKRFRVTGPHARGRAQHRSVLPLGTAFRFTLSRSATVKIEIAQADVHHPCKKGASRCAQMRVIGILTYPDEGAGNDAVNFRGQVGKHALRAGHYLAIVTARNGIARSKAVRLSFVVAQ